MISSCVLPALSMGTDAAQVRKLGLENFEGIPFNMFLSGKLLTNLLESNTQ
jgi:hypothetical protein